MTASTALGGRKAMQMEDRRTTGLDVVVKWARDREVTRAAQGQDGPRLKTLPLHRAEHT